MADMVILIAATVLLMGCFYTEAALPTSTISAAPALLPSSSSPISSQSPNLSPDITPLFPSPYGAAPTPSDSSSLPTIPSSPTTTSPSDFLAPGPSIGASPSEISPSSSSSTLASFSSGSLSSAMFMSLVLLWLMQVSGIISSLVL